MTDNRNTYTYHAFISYCHRDEHWARWLHRAIETYKIRSRLENQAEIERKEVPQRLFPVFRDRDELEGVSNLPERLYAALTESRALIVICSPQGAASHWVNEEIRTFKHQYPKRDVLAVIVGGEPWSGNENECFPEALRFKVGKDGKLTDDREEPGAVDARPGKDGRNNVLLKIVAALIGLPFDQLRQRDQERRRRRLLALSLVLAALSAVLAGLAGFAWHQRGVAQHRARIAQAHLLAAMARDELPTGTGDNFDFSRAILLGVHAAQKEPLPETFAVLTKVLQASPYRVRFLWGHSGTIRKVAFSNDGKSLVSAGTDGNAIVWNRQTAELQVRIAYGAPIHAMALSPLEDVVALSGDGGSILFWDLVRSTTSGSKIQTDEETIFGLAFNPTGQLLATAGTNGGARLWDMTTRRQSGDRLSVHRGTLLDVTFSPDGQSVVTAGDQGQLTLWKSWGNRPIATPLVGHEVSDWGSVNAVVFDHEGRSMISAGSHGKLLAWIVNQDSPSSVPLQGHKALVTSASFNPDGSLLTTGDKVGDIIFWNDSFDAPLRIHGDGVQALAFSPDGRAFASAGNRGRLILWDLDRPPLGKPFTGNREGSGGVALSPDGNYLVNIGPELLAWKSHDRQPSTPARRLFVRSVVFLEEGNAFVASTAKNQILRVDLNTPTTDPILIGRGSTINAMQINPAGSTIDTVTLRHIERWNLSSGGPADKIELLPLPSGPFSPSIKKADFSPDGKTVAWSTGGGEVAFSIVETGESAKLSFAEGPKPERLIGFSPDGLKLLTQDGSGRLSFWPIKNGKISGRPVTLKTALTDFFLSAFTKNGKILATTSGRLTRGRDEITLWNTENGQRLNEPWETSTQVASLAFSPDSQMLAVGGDARIFLWNVHHRKPMAELIGTPERAITGLVFSPDSRTLYSAGGKVVAWNLDLQHLIQLACRTANRNLTQSERVAVAGSDLPMGGVCPEKSPAKNHVDR